MAIAKLALTLSTLFIAIQYIAGHARMVDPLSRSSLWREYRNFPKNHEDNQLYCGGHTIQNINNHGKCGPCGDPYSDVVPRQNENGGRFGKGKIVKTYQSGEKTQVQILINTNHDGYFTFSICKLASPTAVETEECFDQYPLQLINEQGQKSYRYFIGSRKEKHSSSQDYVNIDVFLPQGLKCDRCVMRWHYRTANFWGICDGSEGFGDMKSGNGCGPQENYRNCADVTIQ